MSLESRVKVLIGGDDAGAIAAFKRVQAEAKKTAKTVKESSEESETSGGEGEGESGHGAAIGAGVAAAAGVAVAVLANAAEASAKYSAQLDSLKNALGDAGISYQQNAKDIQSVINANIDYGTKEDDTLTLLEQGVRATGSLSKATALLTEAQNIHAGSTLDLSTAYTAALKGSEGNLRALKQMGIDLPIAAGGAEKTAVALTAVQKAAADLATTQQGANAQDQNVTLKQATALAQARQRVLFLEEQTHGSKKITIAQEQAISIAQEKVSSLEGSAADAGVSGSKAVQAAKERLTTAEQKYWNVADAGQEVNAALNKKFSGAAEAAAGTLEGKQAKLQAQLDKFKRELGDKVVSFLTTDVIPFIEKAGIGFNRLGAIIETDIVSKLDDAYHSAQNLFDSIASAGVAKPHDDTEAIWAANDKLMGWAPGTTAKRYGNNSASGIHGGAAMHLAEAQNAGTGGPKEGTPLQLVPVSTDSGQGTADPAVTNLIDISNDQKLQLAAGTTARAQAGNLAAQKEVHDAQRHLDLVTWLKAIAMKKEGTTIINMHAQPTPATLAASSSRHDKRNGTKSPLPFFGSVAP